MTRFNLAISAGATVLTLATTAFAGPQYIDRTGYAASGYDVVAYFDLDQTPVGMDQPAAIPGRADITADYNGATFAFSTEANRDRFLANPAAFAPQYDGHCAYGVAQGSKVPANPNLWRVVDGKLYLNILKHCQLGVSGPETSRAQPHSQIQIRRPELGLYLHLA